jgi:hypothetical protein
MRVHQHGGRPAGSALSPAAIAQALGPLQIGQRAGSTGSFTTGAYANPASAAGGGPVSTSSS